MEGIPGRVMSSQKDEPFLLCFPQKFSKSAVGKSLQPLLNFAQHRHFRHRQTYHTHTCNKQNSVVLHPLQCDTIEKFVNCFWSLSWPMELMEDFSFIMKSGWGNQIQQIILYNWALFNMKFLQRLVTTQDKWHVHICTFLVTNNVTVGVTQNLGCVSCTSWTRYLLRVSPFLSTSQI